MTVTKVPSEQRRPLKKKKAPTLFLISQSLTKAVQEYKEEKLCGLVLESKYIKKDFPLNADDSAKKKLGRYFEFILTGSLGIDGIVPEPEYKKAALNRIAKSKIPELVKKTLTTKDMTKPYQLAHKNADRVKEYFRKMKIEVLKVNVRFEDEDEGLVGHVDIIAKYNGRMIVIDVKYSGLIEDKYIKYGWRWTPEQKAFHGIQAIQYHKLTGYDVYFLVVSNENEIDILFDKIFIGTWEKENHAAQVIKTRKEVDFILEFGAIPYPEFARCLKCGIREGCNVKIDLPVERTIDLAIE